MSDSIERQRNDDLFPAVVRRLGDCDLAATGQLWIAFSGGLDSTVLLHAARCAYPNGQLAVLHINHGISPRADAWQAHCEREAAALQLKLVVEKVKLRARNIEFAGRRARIKVFNSLLHSDDVVATAHHRDDELESLLWQLGTGRALVGIAACRELMHGRLWRPLLEFRRKALETVARRRGWTWIDDESNADTSYTRNALRHEVLPKLRSTFPTFESNLLKLKELPLDSIARKPLAVASIVDNPLCVRAWLHAFRITAKSSVVDEIVRQATARNDAQVLIRVASDRSVRRYRGMLYVVADAAPHHAAVPVGRLCRLPMGELSWKISERGLSAAKRVQIRTRIGGERLLVDGRRVKLADWLAKRNVPPWQRDTWPLLFDDGQLVAVPGLGVADTVCQPDGWEPRWRAVDEF